MDKDLKRQFTKGELYRNEKLAHEKDVQYPWLLGKCRFKPQRDTTIKKAKI